MKTIQSILHKTACHISLQILLIICLVLLMPLQSNAEDIMRRGDAYVIYLPAETNFNEVVDRLEYEVLGENWQIVDQLDIGDAVKEFDKHTDNRVISVCKLQYLAQAIEEDPFISLIIPCRFTIFREPSGNDKKGRIVVGFYDPAAEAEGLDLKQAQAAEIASNELKAVLLRVADFYHE